MDEDGDDDNHDMELFCDPPWKVTRNYNDGDDEDGDDENDEADEEEEDDNHLKAFL